MQELKEYHLDSQVKILARNKSFKGTAKFRKFDGKIRLPCTKTRKKAAAIGLNL